MNRVTGQGQLIFGVAIAALGGEHVVCAQMAVQPFPSRFHAIVIPVIPWVPAHPWLAYVIGAALIVTGFSILSNMRSRGGALFFGALFLGCDLILHIPRMIVVPQNWGLRGEVCEMLALSAAALVLAGTLPPADGTVRRSDRTLANTGRVLFGISSVVFGVDHSISSRALFQPGCQGICSSRLSRVPS